jgi:hypothetical protein
MKVMDHSEAIRMGATEKYLLGELKGEERERFEEHFFVCAECAADVKGGALFLSGAKKELLGAQAAPARVAVGREPRRASWLETWLRPQIVVPVLAALIFVIVYQNLVLIPHMKNPGTVVIAPQPLQSFSLVAANSRGGEPVKIQTVADSPFGLYVDVPPGGNYASYSLRVKDSAGKTQFSVDVPAAQAKDTVQVLVPASTLAAGNYALEVHGVVLGASADAASSPIASFVFSLEYKQ